MTWASKSLSQTETFEICKISQWVGRFECDVRRAQNWKPKQWSELFKMEFGRKKCKIYSERKNNCAFWVWRISITRIFGFEPTSSLRSRVYGEREDEGGREELRRIRTLFCNYHPVTLPSTYSRLRSEVLYSLLLPSVYPTRNFGLGPSIDSLF